jgi:hypothetical protein
LLTQLKEYARRLDGYLDRVWPQRGEERGKPPVWQLWLLALLGALLLGLLIQDYPILGYDWLITFQHNLRTAAYYPPWTAWLLAPFAALPWRLGLGLINGLALSTIALMTYYQGRERAWRVLATLLALFSLQTAHLLWLGQIDGYAMWGIWGLPWSVPLVLMKSSFVVFVVFSRKSWFYAALIFLVLSLAIWPGWMLGLVGTLEQRTQLPFAGGWHVTGWAPVLLGLFLLLRGKRSDPFQNLAAGALIHPFVLPYHFVVLLPALGDLRGLRLALAWLAAWAMIVPIVFERFHLVYFVFPVAIWLFRQRETRADETWAALVGPLKWLAARP